jgi:hypothetical protein
MKQRKETTNKNRTALGAAVAARSIGEQPYDMPLAAAGGRRITDAPLERRDAARSFCDDLQKFAHRAANGRGRGALH